MQNGTQPRSRRVRTVRIDPQTFVNMCKNTAQLHVFAVTKNPLPADAQVVGAAYDATVDLWLLSVESDEFEPVSPGCYPEDHGMTVFHELTVDRVDRYSGNGLRW